jgi:hypothetical protein
MKNEKYHTFGTIPIWNIKIVERGNSDTTNTQTHDLSLYVEGLYDVLFLSSSRKQREALLWQDKSTFPSEIWRWSTKQIYMEIIFVLTIYIDLSNAYRNKYLII